MIDQSAAAFQLKSAPGERTTSRVDSLSLRQVTAALQVLLAARRAARIAAQTTYQFTIERAA